MQAMVREASSQVHLVGTFTPPWQSHAWCLYCSSTTSQPGGDNSRGQEINGGEELGEQSFLQQLQCTATLETQRSVYTTPSITA